MLHKSNFSIKAAVANWSGAMEADTISKNGRSSKSQTSRRKLYLPFLLCLFWTVSLSSYGQNIIINQYNSTEGSSTVTRTTICCTEGALLWNNCYVTKCYGSNYDIYDANGKKIISCKEEITLLPNGHYKAKCYGSNYDIYDANGEKIISCKEEITLLPNGQYKAKCYGSNYDIYNANGDKIISCKEM